MFSLIGVLVVAFLSVNLLIPLLIDYCHLFQVYDQSDFHRKRHHNSTPRMGGVAIFFGFIIGILPIDGFFTKDIIVLLLAASIVFYVGLKDDLLGGIKPMEKIFVQFISAIILVFWTDCRLQILDGIFGIDLLEKSLSTGLTIFIIVFITNAFNLIDGIDGLCGTLSVYANLCFGILFFHLGDIRMVILSLAIIASISGFLRYNYVPSKIFMGDSGSLLIGLLSVTSALKLLTIGHKAPNQTSIDFVPALVVAVFVIPVFDAIRVLFLRILKQKSPFEGDRNHLHHKLLDLGCQSSDVVSIFILFNSVMLMFVLFCCHLGSAILITFQILICMLLNTWLSYKKGRKLNPYYRIRDIFLKDTF